MEKLDKVIAGLEHCARDSEMCSDCPYNDVGRGCYDVLGLDALDLLKELSADNQRLRGIWAEALKMVSIARAERDAAREKLARITGEREAAWLEQERPDEWRDNCDSYRCPSCGFETDNPNRLENRGVWCPRCGKQLRWNVMEVADV